MKTNLNLILSFDIHDNEGKSLLNGNYNAIRTSMGINEPTSNDITAINLWLQHALWDLWKDELTSGLMPPLVQAQAAQNGNTGDKDHLPVLSYENFHIQMKVHPKCPECRSQVYDEL